MLAVSESIGLLAFVATATGGAMLVTAIMLVLDGVRARGRIAALEAEIERQNDIIWDLRESEERTRSLIEGQGDLIVRRDVRGRITYANEAFCELAGQSRERLIGSEFRLPVAETGAREAREGTLVRRDEAIATASGLRWIEWQDVPVRGAGRGRPETQSVGRDVTARRQAERDAALARDSAEAASKAKSRFLATVTHEIRTPLGGILGLADLLLDTRLAPDQTTYAKAIKTSGEALLSLIDEILDFSKVEAGHIELDERPFSLTGMVEDVVELLAPRAYAKAIEIAAHVDPAVPTRVFGDAGRLKQVILNLAGNAVKFTEAGGVVIRVRPDGGRIVFEVEDTGIGITAENLPIIFHEFEQADATPARRVGGTGLGLAISKRIVERMGGSIVVESEPKRGSTFRVSLAFAAAPSEAADHVTLPRGRRVLVASPSPVVAPTLAAMLADLAVDAVIERDAGRAIARIEDEAFDGVLVDRSLGLEEAARVSARGLAAGQRVIALVTPVERHELGRLTGSGAAGYLIKPVRAASLLTQITGRPRPVPANDDAAQPAARPLLGLSVLLAEDNEINALVARTVLGRLGADVAWAKDGREAVALHGAGLFDAILMDMHMPDLDGPGAARAIRAIEDEARRLRTPIYALTANVQEEDRDICIAAGMDAFLTKPLDRDELVALLEPLAGGTALPAAESH
jgi:PAS domain S-box-containing protein